MFDTTPVVFCISCNLSSKTDDAICIPAVHTVNFLYNAEVGELVSIHDVYIFAASDVWNIVEWKKNAMVNLYPNITEKDGKKCAPEDWSENNNQYSLCMFE